MCRAVRRYVDVARDIRGGPAMGIVSWIVLGLIAGYLARFLMPGRVPGGFVLTILLGIVGALVGGYVGSHVLGFGEVSGIDLRSMAIAVAGAVLLLFVVGLLRKARWS
jgi:uncharacterized membrane protein YeaQ/YmgE (transglycosylase-associated protein family)